MSAELATQFINAADSAYELGGYASKLAEILDATCSISEQNTITMSDLAEAMSAAGAQAEQLGVRAEKTAAMHSTIISAAHQNGTEASEAFGDIKHFCVSFLFFSTAFSVNLPEPFFPN